MGRRPVSDLKLRGGDPVLDFVNSIDDHGSPSEQDFIVGYDAFILWCGHSGLLDSGEAGRLRSWGRKNGADAAAIANLAIMLREALRAILEARNLGKSPGAEALRTVNNLLPSRSELAFEDGAFRLHQAGSEGAAPLHMLAARAVQLLSSDLQHRIRICDGTHCNWFFLDRSRSRPRRWCSMEGCGNRAKGQRYVARRRRAAPARKQHSRLDQ